MRIILKIAGWGLLLWGAIRVIASVVDMLDGYHDTNRLVWGAAILAAGFALVFWEGKIKTRRQEEVTQMDNELAVLKEQGDAIPVDLMACEIIANSFTQELYEKASEMAFYDSMYGRGDKNIVAVKLNLARLAWETDYKGNRVKFVSHPINKDMDTLRMKMYIQKQTYIYIDRNTGAYYFDVEFLQSDKV